MKKYEKGGAVEEPKKDEKGNRTKYVESFPPSIIQKGAAKASQMLDKMGFRQDEAYEGKSAKQPVKKAEGGMLKKKRDELVKENMRSSSRISKYDQEKVERMLSGEETKKEKSNSRPTIRDQEKAEKLMGFKKGGMVKARGQGKVMKTKSCKIY